MSNETPGTRTDDATGAEGDSNQLSSEDSLVDRGVEDPLDEGYAPPERPRSNHFGETPLEEAEGESLDQRLAEEQPEAWEGDDPEAREPERAGRLESDSQQGKQNDIFAVDDGFSGGAATAEEAAVHVVPDDRADPEDRGDGSADGPR